MLCITHDMLIDQFRAEHLQYVETTNIPVIRTYSELIGKPLPAPARIVSMLSTEGRENAFVAVIGDGGCVLSTVFLPKEIHDKAMGISL